MLPARTCLPVHVEVTDFFQRRQQLRFVPGYPSARHVPSLHTIMNKIRKDSP